MAIILILASLLATAVTDSLAQQKKKPLACKTTVLAAFKPLRIDSDRGTRGYSDRCGIHDRSGHVCQEVKRPAQNTPRYAWVSGDRILSGENIGLQR